jgi:hypothetical protein
MQTLTETIYERGARFLQTPEILARMDDQTRSDMNAGKKEFFLADFYIRKKLSGFAGTIDLIKEIDNKQVGVNNMDKGVLPTGTYMALCVVGASYALDSAAVTPDIPAGLRYSSAEYLNTIPTKIINSEFTLLNGDKPVMKVRTKKFFANAYAEFGGEANEENGVVLPQPKLLDYRKKIKLQLEFAEDATAIPSGNHYLEIRLAGVYVGDRI